MNRYSQKRKGPLRPLVANLTQKLARSDSRLRRNVVRFSAFLFLGFVVYSFMAGSYGLFRISRLESRKVQLINQNRLLLARIVDSDYNRRRLKKDSHFIEYIARTRYHLSRPGEIVVRIQR